MCCEAWKGIRHACQLKVQHGLIPVGTCKLMTEDVQTFIIPHKLMVLPREGGQLRRQVCYTGHIVHLAVYSACTTISQSAPVTCFTRKEKPKPDCAFVREEDGDRKGMPTRAAMLDDST